MFNLLKSIITGALFAAATLFAVTGTSASLHHDSPGAHGHGHPGGHGHDHGHHGGHGHGSHHHYAVFTNVLPSGEYHGLWVENMDHPGSSPTQVTDQILDHATNSLNTAILHGWSYDPTHNEALNVRARLIVYGMGGTLYADDPQHPASSYQFSNGHYAALCGISALDGLPFGQGASYVIAQVIPAGSSGDCSIAADQQTWLIPANAGASTAPTIKSSDWSVLSAFWNPSTGAFVNWLIRNGSEIGTADMDFSHFTPLLSGLSSDVILGLSAAPDGHTAFMIQQQDTASTSTIGIYRLTPSAATVVGSFSYPVSSPCYFPFGSASSAMDTDTGLFAFTVANASGYSVYSLPVSGGGANLIYADNSGTTCGSATGDSPSAGHVVLNENNLVTGASRVIGVAETGPAAQVPAVLDASTADGFTSARYTIAGHVWIDHYDVLPDSSYIQSTYVRDGDGTHVADYPGAINRDDIWHGFHLGGEPVVDRDAVYLFTPNAAYCNGGTLSVVDPVSFAQTAVSGLPADACGLVAFGWEPESIGNVQEPAGNSAIAIDPLTAQLYVLTGPAASGSYQNIESLPSYPFF
ncbi:MAG TPA: hypothetical protein VFX47_05585 [Gammaproteobacteria bacterium]|nr:hypothetical protein [Gammaproteobacteria bacterium]